MYATYNITNNRLFFWPESSERLPADEYKACKNAGFVWWPRGCFTAIWSTSAEDWIIAKGLTIEADDTPDNVESRVERFSKYADNAEKTAESASERAMNATTARRARLAENVANREAENAEYWQRRIAGAIAHANQHDDPRTCANRVKGIEADKRREERTLEEHKKFLAAWERCETKERAVYIANYDHIGFSLWSALTDGKIEWQDAKTQAIAHHHRVINDAERTHAHLIMRLEYERAYLDAVGGTELLAPKPRKAPAKAPEDGFKKGMHVSFVNWYNGKAQTGTIHSIGPKHAKILRDGDGFQIEVYRKDIKAIA